MANEEAGELVKAVNDLYFHAKGSKEDVVKEAIQMLAMGVRFLVDTPNVVGD